MSKLSKICHLTSVHKRYDTRIFVKECCSLAKNNLYAVTLIVADGLGDEITHNVTILDAEVRKGGRLTRFTHTVLSIYAKALIADADLYHLHDPELIPIGLKLKRLGKKVVFDAHEDFPKQILSKPYLSKPTKLILSRVSEAYERYACRKLDAIVAATPFIRDKFVQINPHTVDINNFPILGELTNDTPWDEKRNEVCYIGGIAKIRGIIEIVEAMSHTDNARLSLAGSFESDQTRIYALHTPGWDKVNELGFLDRAGVADLLRYSKAGLVTLHPTQNYIDALPVKMFEYMAAGIPVIASDFPLWRSILESNCCGLLVDPLNPLDITKAIDYLIAYPKEAQMMGKNGQQAVRELYNWQREEEKLITLYKELLP